MGYRCLVSLPRQSPSAGGTEQWYNCPGPQLEELSSDEDYSSDESLENAPTKRRSRRTQQDRPERSYREVSTDSDGESSMDGGANRKRKRTTSAEPDDGSEVLEVLSSSDDAEDDRDKHGRTPVKKRLLRSRR